MLAHNSIKNFLMVIVFMLYALKISWGRELFAEGILNSTFRKYTCREGRKVDLGRQRSWSTMQVQLRPPRILQGALELGRPIGVVTNEHKGAELWILASASYGLLASSWNWCVAVGKAVPFGESHSKWQLWEVSSHDSQQLGEEVPQLWRGDMSATQCIYYNMHCKI